MKRLLGVSKITAIFLCATLLLGIVAGLSPMKVYASTETLTEDEATIDISDEKYDGVDTFTIGDEISSITFTGTRTDALVIDNAVSSELLTITLDSIEAVGCISLTRPAEIIIKGINSFESTDEALKLTQPATMSSTEQGAALTLNANGKNAISTSAELVLDGINLVAMGGEGSDAKDTAAILASGADVLIRDSNISATGGKSTDGKQGGHAVVVENANLTIDNSSVTATAESGSEQDGDALVVTGADKELNVVGGELNLNGFDGINVAGGASITNCDVDIQAKNEAIVQSASDMELAIDGGTIKLKAFNGINAVGNVDIKNCDLDIEAGSIQIDAFEGQQTEGNAGNCINSEKDVDITVGSTNTVKLQGGDGNSDNNLNVLGGTGIFALGSILIDSTGTVEINGGYGTGRGGLGIEARGDVSLKGAMVITAGDSYSTGSSAVSAAKIKAEGAVALNGGNSETHKGGHAIEASTSAEVLGAAVLKGGNGLKGGGSGVQSNGSIDINGAVDVRGGNSSEQYGGNGIYSLNGIVKFDGTDSFYVAGGDGGNQDIGGPAVRTKTTDKFVLENKNGVFKHGTSEVGQNFTDTFGILPKRVLPSSPAGVNATEATLRGFIMSNNAGEETEVIFEYGTSTSYGATATSSPATVTSKSVSVMCRAEVTGLQPSTVYHYRLVATSANGTVVSRDFSFTTPAQPVVETSHIVKSGSLIFRAGPDTGSEVYSRLLYGTQVTGISLDGEWLKVRVGEQVGYMAAEYLADSPMTAHVESTTLSVRTTPSTSAVIFKTLNKYDAVSVVGRTGAFLHIDINGTTYYVGATSNGTALVK